MVFSVRAEYATQQDLITKIEALSEDRTSDPYQIVAKLKEFTDIAKDNNWQKSIALSNVIAMNLYMSIEDFAEIEILLAETKPVAANLNDLETDIRLQIIELNLFISKNMLVEAKQIQIQLQEKTKVIEDPVLLADVYQQLGQSQEETENFSESIANLTKAYDLYLEQGDDYGVASTLVTLGNLYLAIGGYDMSIEYNSKALNYIRQENDKFGESIVLYNIASAYLRQDNCDKALDFSSLSTQVATELNDNIGVAWSSMITADCFSMNENWENALEIYQSVEPVFEETNILKMQVNALNGIARAAMMLSQFNLAEISLEKGKSLISSGVIWDKQYKYLELRSQLYFLQKDYLNAYLSQEKMLEVQSQINENKTEQDLQRSRLEFDSELKETENASLQKQNELNEQLIKQQENQNQVFIFMLILMLVLLLAVFIFSINQFSLRKKFKSLSLEDPLTKTRNRRSILQKAELMYKQAKQNRSALSVMLIDLDKFKTVNDTFGHDVGDNVLKAFAKACESSLRDTDAFGRYGGEEWLVILPNDNRTIVDKVFNRISDELNKQDIKGLDKQHNITFSMGVVTFSNDTNISLNKLIAEADNLLYSAKENGRNRYYIDTVTG